MLKVAWSPLFAHPLPEGHRFPMEKYTLIPEQLRYEGTLREENFYEPGLTSEADILRAHDQDYWHKLKLGQLSKREARKTGFPFSPLLVKRGRCIAQGTIDNLAFAKQYGIAMNTAGGTHHAFRDHGEGFCLLNDFAIAAYYALENGLAKKILILDLDVHQGNGTAEIFRNQERVFTFSMHCEANYPLQKMRSDLDIGLAQGTEDDVYLQTLIQYLSPIVQQAQPDFIFYLAGVDILHTDKLGKLACTKTGCKERDRIVLELCRQQGIPVIVSLGGGYSVHIKDIVEAHCNTFRLAQALYF